MSMSAERKAASTYCFQYGMYLNPEPPMFVVNINPIALPGPWTQLRIEVTR